MSGKCNGVDLQFLRMKCQQEKPKRPDATLLGGVRALAIGRTIVPLYTAGGVTCTRPRCPCVLPCSVPKGNGQAKEGSDLEASTALGHWSSELESCQHHARVWEESVWLDRNYWSESLNKFCFVRACLRVLPNKEKRHNPFIESSLISKLKSTC